MASKKKPAAKSAQQIRRQKLLANLAKGRATRAANLAKKKQQAAKLLASMTPAQQKAVGKAATKARKTGTSPKPKATKTRARKGTVTSNLSSRAKRLANAIRTGRVAVRQNVKSVKQAQGTTKRAKYQKFLAIYEGVRIPKKFTGIKHKSPRAHYRLAPGVQGQTKFPYYLAAGYTSRVGGGASGPGVVRAIPKSGAPAFRSLSEDQQRRVVAFLNTEAGKKLRGKGAKRSVSFQAIKQALKTVKSGPGVARKKQQKKASANYGW